MITQRDAINLVSPFRSTDATRPQLAGVGRFASHIVATDGHAMAVCRYDGVHSPSAMIHDDSSGVSFPPWVQVIPAAVTCVGLIVTPARLRHMPAKWHVIVTLSDGCATLHAIIPGKRKMSALTMIECDALTGFETVHPTQPVTINAGYLVRCADLATAERMGDCYVYADGPLDPLVFAPEGHAKTRDDLLLLDRFAVCMPVRCRND